LLGHLLLLQCPWFSGLVFWWSWWVLAYSFHSSWVVWLIALQVFSLISILSSSSKIVSSTCSSLLKWPSTVLCVSVLFFFSDVFHILCHHFFNFFYFHL
jgi:hypothetical protein